MVIENVRNGRLIAHCGTFPSTLDEVLAVPPAPKLGRFHNPVQHRDLIGMLHDRADTMAITPLWNDSKWALSKDRHNIFGVVPIDDDHGDWKAVMGVRNSTKSDFSIGIVAGDNVTNCDNLLLNGEIKSTRKNTIFALKALPLILDHFLSRFIQWTGEREGQVNWLKERTLSQAEQDRIVMRLIDSAFIPVNRIKPLVKELAQPCYEEFNPNTAWGLTNCVTEVMKNASPTRHMIVGTGINRILRDFGMPHLQENLIDEAVVIE